MIFINNVTKKLNMSQNDVSQFIPPKVTFNEYCRVFVNGINKSQMNLFLNILNFPDDDTTFNISHDCYFNKCKFYIEKYEFKKSSKKSSTLQLMSFIKHFNTKPRNLIIKILTKQKFCLNIHIGSHLIAQLPIRFIILSFSASINCVFSCSSSN